MADLKHFGILGMKWGIRRRGPASREHTEAREIRKKHVSELSNDEIRKAVSRMQLEKQFNDLSSASTKRGGGILRGILSRVGAQLVNNYVRQQAGPSYEGYNAFAQEVKKRAGKAA